MLHKFKQILENENKAKDKLIDAEYEKYNGFKTFNKNKTSAEDLQKLRAENNSDKRYAQRAYADLSKTHASNPKKMEKLTKAKEFEDYTYNSREKLLSDEANKRKSKGGGLMLAAAKSILK